MPALQLPWDSERHDQGEWPNQILSEIQSLKEIVVREFAEVKIELVHRERSDSAGAPSQRKSSGTSVNLELHRASQPRRKKLSITEYPRIDEDTVPIDTVAIPTSPKFAKHLTELSVDESRLSSSDATTKYGSNAFSESRHRPIHFQSRFHDLKKRLGEGNFGQRNATKIDPVEASSIAANISKFDPESIKQRIRHSEALHPSERLRIMYHKDGCFQKIATHPWFEHVSLVVIVANAMWMAIETDKNKADTIIDASFGFVLADSCFYAYFVIELFIRFMAFKRTRGAFGNAWFVVDLALVCLYTFDPFLLGFIEMWSGAKLNLPIDVLRLLRLARLSRLTRILRSFPELVIMIHGMLTAMATVGYAMGLLGLITYVFAIAIRSLTPAGSQIERLYFATVSETVHHLFIYGAFMDSLAVFITNIKAESVPILILSWCYIALSALMIMNLLIGILCEVTSAVATEQKEIMLVRQVHQDFAELVRKFDKDNSGTLTWQEFSELLSDDHCHVALTRIDVNLEGLIDMAEDIFFYEHGCDGEVELTYQEFTSLLLDLRGSQQASVKDVLTIGKRLNTKVFELKAMLEIIETKLGVGDNWTSSPASSTSVCAVAAS